MKTQERKKLEHLAENTTNEAESKTAMLKLRNTFNATYHWCPDWDYMVICDEDKEIEGCSCEIHKRVRESTK